jgi:hypothetical protein
MSETATSEQDSPLADADGASSIRERVKGTNINEKSLLATDYLNHFNEIVMVIELIPDMPDILDEARAWLPKSYPDHFRESGFSDKELAIAAYEVAPQDYREMFDGTVDRLDRLVALSLERIESALASGEQGKIELVAGRATNDLKRLIDVASAIINGTKPTISQDEIDDLLEE